MAARRDQIRSELGALQALRIIVCDQLHARAAESAENEADYREYLRGYVEQYGEPSPADTAEARRLQEKWHAEARRTGREQFAERYW